MVTGEDHDVSSRLVCAGATENRSGAIIAPCYASGCLVSELRCEVN